MLVLSRRPGETVLLKVPGLDPEIEVTVVRVQGPAVRLGVTAPRDVTVRRAELRDGQVPPGPVAPTADRSAPTAQAGDRVRVHYVKRFQDGAAASSRSRAPLELTVGTDHPRLPGLGSALVGLAPGATVTVSVPPGRAYRPPDPARVHRWARTRFREDQPLPVGEWVQLLNRRGQRRLVRVLEVRDRTVVVDTNHHRAGQAVELEVELIGIETPDTVAVRRVP